MYFLVLGLNEFIYIIEQFLAFTKCGKRYHFTLEGLEHLAIPLEADSDPTAFSVISAPHFILCIRELLANGEKGTSTGATVQGGG